MDGAEKIPRVVHYCWFGRGEKPKLIKKCIQSWQKHLPDYELVEWNEDTFDVKANLYAREAYEARKFAFVSDYVRLHALYHEGGVYMDTDVEVIKPLHRFLVHEAFSGFEDHQFLQSGTMGAVKHHPWIGELLQYYADRPFLLQGGDVFDLTTNTAIMSRISQKHGLKLNGQHQTLPSGVVFYPRWFFSPYDYINGGNYINDDSYTIHHFAQSWLPAHVRVKSYLKRKASRLIGAENIARLRRILSQKGAQS